jgi:hypothetical protein
MPAAGTGWVTAFVCGSILLEAVLLAGLTLFADVPFWAAFSVLGVLALTAVFVWAIVPRGFEVYDDRLVLIFPLWPWSIDMASIELARPATWWQSYGYAGLRFATSPAQAVELRRVRPNLLRRPNLIISPADREHFLVELNTALARYRRLPGALV